MFISEVGMREANPFPPSFAIYLNEHCNQSIKMASHLNVSMRMIFSYIYIFSLSYMRTTLLLWQNQNTICKLPMVQLLILLALVFGIEHLKD